MIPLAVLLLRNDLAAAVLVLSSSVIVTLGVYGTALLALVSLVLG